MCVTTVYIHYSYIGLNLYIKFLNHINQSILSFRLDCSKVKSVN